MRRRTHTESVFTLAFADSDGRALKGLYSVGARPYTTGVTTTLRRMSCALLLLAVCVSLGPSTQASSSRLPARLSDADFWTLVTELSEPGGTFRSENLLSNEARFQFVIPELVEGIRPGGVY